MYRRIKHLLIFRLERLMMRGPGARFAFIVGLLLLAAVTAGLLVRLLVPGFESFADALWWAFEHLVVPEYVDGDEGIVKTTAATVLIVLGSILFAGAIIAILVQWLNETTARLELGLTPVALDGHIVLLGWTSRTPVVLAEVLASQGRVERFLHRRGVRRLHIAVLAEHADADLLQELKDALDEAWDPERIIVRRGSSIILDDLARVDFTHAAVIVIPATDATTASAMDADTRTVKTLLTLRAALGATALDKGPLVVAELQDPRYSRTLHAVYGGALEIIAGDEIIARLMVQTVRNPGLSSVFAELLSDVQGSQVYVREEPDLVGCSVRELTHAYRAGVLLGIVRPAGAGFQALLNAPDDMRLEPGDRVAVLARSYRDAAPPRAIGAAIELAEKTPVTRAMPAERRVLVLGWNGLVPLLLGEFAAYPDERFAIDVVSLTSAAKRQKIVAAEAIKSKRLTIRHLEFDHALPAALESVEPGSYDNVLLLAGERLKSGAETDARVIMSYLLLHELTAESAHPPPTLVELTGTDNIALFETWRGEIIASPQIVSHMLARVAMRRELRAVFDELFGSSGAEIQYRRVTDFGLDQAKFKGPDGDAAGTGCTFADFQQASDSRGEIAIGVRRSAARREPGGGVELSPGRDEHLHLAEGDELIVLTTGA